MSHLLIGLAICAALFIYPGGACLVAAWLLVLVGARSAAGEPLKPPTWPWPDQHLIDWLLAGFLSALVVVPLSWPADPIRQISVGGLSGLGLGGVALTLAGLWSLAWLGRRRLEATGAVPLALAWSLGLVLLATTMRSPGWAGLVGTAGLGQVLLRSALGALGLIALPWVAGPDPDRNLFAAACWAAWLAVDLSLLVPDLQNLPFPAVLGSWWGLSLVASLIVAAGAARSSRWLAGRRNPTATDRM